MERKDIEKFQDILKDLDKFAERMKEDIQGKENNHIDELPASVMDDWLKGAHEKLEEIKKEKDPWIAMKLKDKEIASWLNAILSHLKGLSEKAPVEAQVTDHRLVLKKIGILFLYLVEKLDELQIECKPKKSR